VQEHASKFRLDRRLQQRRGWIASDQLEKDLSGLPDVSDKAEVVDSPQHKGEAAPATDGERADE
jgi:hypothetical protein